MLKRLFNVIILTILPVCVYTTFSVKNDVYNMQKKENALLRLIANEHDMITVYRAEWANLTSANNITTLSKKLMPDFKTVSYAQMSSPQNIPFKDTYFAEPHITKNAFSVTPGSYKP